MDSVQINNDPHGSPEAQEAQKTHEEQMIKAADSGVTSIQGQPTATEGEAPTDAPVVPQRPEAIPEKFWNAETGTVNTEAMIKEEEYRKANDGLPAPKEEEPEVKDEVQAGDVVATAETEFARDGKLSDGTYDALAKAGLDRGTVDAYIAGQEALVGQLQSAAYSSFEGGAETFSAAQEWARSNLSEGEIAALDVQLGSDNPAIVAAGAKALATQYAQDADVTPTTTVVGDGGRQTTSGGHFKSSMEMQTAMADPRYKNDSAFRQEVAEKISRAAANGVNLF